MGRAAELIRQARSRAGWTQAELARRCGVPQNVISDYERGKREPSFRAVDVILNATGVVLEIAPYSALDRVRDQREEVLRTLGEHGASNVSVFGSVARREETPLSDVDLLIDVTSGTGLFDLLRAQEELEVLLGRPVDLVPRSGLKPEIATAIAADAVPL